MSEKITFKCNETINGFIDQEIKRKHDKAEWMKVDGKKRIVDMDSAHLQLAFETLQYRELQRISEIEKINDIKDHLLYEASNRGIRLMWLDEVKKQNYGGIFKAERALRKIAEYYTLMSSFIRVNMRKKFVEKEVEVKFELSKNSNDLSIVKEMQATTPQK